MLALSFTAGSALTAPSCEPKPDTSLGWSARPLDWEIGHPNKHSCSELLESCMHPVGSGSGPQSGADCCKWMSLFTPNDLWGKFVYINKDIDSKGIEGNKTILDLCETTCAPYQVGHCFEEATCEPLPDAPLGTDPTGEEISCRIIFWRALLSPAKATGKDICNSMAQSTPAKDIAAGLFSPAAGLNTKANYLDLCQTTCFPYTGHCGAANYSYIEPSNYIEPALIVVPCVVGAFVLFIMVMMMKKRGWGCFRPREPTVELTPYVRSRE